MRFSMIHVWVASSACCLTSCTNEEQRCKQGGGYNTGRMSSLCGSRDAISRGVPDKQTYLFFAGVRRLQTGAGEWMGAWASRINHDAGDYYYCKHIRQRYVWGGGEIYLILTRYSKFRTFLLFLCSTETIEEKGIPTKTLLIKRINYTGTIEYCIIVVQYPAICRPSVLLRANLRTWEFDGATLLDVHERTEYKTSHACLHICSGKGRRRG